MLAKNSICSSEQGKSFFGNTMKASSFIDNEKKNPKLAKAFEKTQIQVKNQILDDLLQVYGWRSKTELPIAKVMFYKVIQKNSVDKLTTIDVSYESFPMTLSDLNQISLKNLLYLIKEAVIGFQKLFNVFGSFLISNKMVAVNKNNRCKVWINQNFAVNEPIDVEMFKNLNEKTFLNQIIELFRKKAEKNKRVELLFNDLSKCEKFQDIIKGLDMFSKNSGVEIGACYKVDEADQRKNNVSKSPLRNPNQLTNASFIADKSKQTPSFLTKSQIKNSNQNLTSSKVVDLTASKSITKSFVRNKTPLNHNRSQINLYTPNGKGPISPLASYIKKDFSKVQTSDVKDYSFQKKNKSSSPLESKKPKLLISSTNSLSQQDIEGIFQGTSYTKKFQQKNQVQKSDLKTTHTNDSSITTKPKTLLLKKPSIFDDQRGMLESVVVGNEHEKIRSDGFRTTDLEVLGKLGKTLIESYMPEDFQN